MILGQVSSEDELRIMSKKNMGSSIDDFLKKENIFEES